MEYIHRVPPELFQPIILAIRSKADLCSVALCCKDFTIDAQNQLFKNPFSGEHSAKAHRKFLETISDSPERLALYVIIYRQITPQFTGSGISQYRREKDPNYNVLMNLTTTALRLMENLQHLEYRPFNAEAGQLAMTALSNCQFPRLEALDWWGTGQLYQAFTMIQKFFPAHPRLKHLGVSWMASNIPSWSVPPHLLQDLESLAGPWATFTAFMPGRTITRLPWRRRHDYRERMLLEGTDLDADLARVRYLAYDFPGPEMGDTLRMVPNLEELELYITSSGNAKSHLSQISILKHLTALVITARDGFPVREFLLEETHREIAALAFSSSETLQTVDIDSGEAVYSRYRAVRRASVESGLDVAIVKVEF